VFLCERDRYIYNDVARPTGSIIFSASHAGEMSFESPQIKNSFFTHEILEALRSNQPDTNQAGKISIDEIEAFVSLRRAEKRWIATACGRPRQHQSALSFSAASLTGHPKARQTTLGGM
jgi:hypothetical protein